jgi:hypothetical protein
MRATKNMLISFFVLLSIFISGCAGVLSLSNVPKDYGLDVDKGKGVVVTSFRVSCKYCINMISYLRGVDNDYSGGVVAYHVNEEGDWAESRLAIMEMPQGEYEFYSHSEYVVDGHILRPVNEYSLRFKVIPGKAVYIGNIHFSLKSKSKSGLAFRGYSRKTEINDMQERDLTLLYQKNPKIKPDNVVVNIIKYKDKRKREEKLNQEKIQSKQLAYIPNTATSSSDNDIVYNKLDGDKRHSLAVFPFCEYALESTTVKQQKEFTNFIIKYTNNIPKIILTHSFYPYYKHKTDSRLRLINTLIDEELEKEIWYGNSTSPRNKPDYNVLKNLAKKIKSDLILTFKITSSPVHTNELLITYNGYLVDIEKNVDYEKLYRKYYNEESIGFVEFDIVKKMTKDLFELYLNPNSQIGDKHKIWKLLPSYLNKLKP